MVMTRTKNPYKLIEVILAAVLVASPLLFGSVYPWAYGLFEIAILLASLAWLLFLPPDSGAFDAAKAGLLLLAAFVIFAGIQLIPLPAAVTSLLSPESAKLWNLDFLDPSILRPQAYLPLSLSPQATASQGFLFLCYFLAVCLTILVASNAPHGKRDSAFRLICIIVLTGVFVAGVGIVQLGVGAKAIYGFFKPLYSSSFMGPYVNRNNFAGYLEMALPLCVALLGVLSLEQRHLPRGEAGSRLHLFLLVLASLVIIIAAIWVSGSRGGILSATFIMIIQVPLVISLAYKRLFGPRSLVLILAMVAALALAANMTDWSKIFPRFENIFKSDVSQNIRLVLAKDVWQMASKFPLTGSGLGTFSKAYPPFKTIPRQGLFVHAHNDYLEFLAETGWPGFLLLMGFFAWVLWRGGGLIVRSLQSRRGRDPRLAYRALLVTGAMGGVLSILMHGLADFNLRIPANALTFFVLCGLTIALSGSGQHRRD